MIDLFARYLPALLQGLAVTGLLTAIVWAAGIIGGTVLGVLARRGMLLAGSLHAGALLTGAIPILVILMWLHFPAQALLGIVVDPFVTTAIALSLVNVLLVGDTVGRTIANLPQEWAFAARTAGLTPGQIARRIVLPLAFRQLIGPIVFIQVSMLHATLFGSLISVDELFRTIQRINAIEYKPVELYTFLALFFFVICAPLQLAARAATRRFSRDVAP